MISPATRPTPKHRDHRLRPVVADQPFGIVVAFTDLLAHLVDVAAGGPGRMLDAR